MSFLYFGRVITSKNFIWNDESRLWKKDLRAIKSDIFLLLQVVFFEIFLFDANGNIDEPSVAGLAKPDDQLQEKMRQVGMTITDFHTGANRVKASLNKIEYYQVRYSLLWIMSYFKSGGKNES